MSAGTTTVVGSVAVSFAVLVSPPPATATMFVTDVAALDATFTVSVMDGYAVLAAKASLRVHDAGLTVQVQPVPAIAVAVNPVGTVSVTVTMPVVEAFPTLLAVMV